MNSNYFREVCRDINKVRAGGTFRARDIIKDRSMSHRYYTVINELMSSGFIVRTGVRGRYMILKNIPQEIIDDGGTGEHSPYNIMKVGDLLETRQYRMVCIDIDNHLEVCNCLILTNEAKDGFMYRQYASEHINSSIVAIYKPNGDISDSILSALKLDDLSDKHQVKFIRRGVVRVTTEEAISIIESHFNNKINIKIQ